MEPASHAINSVPKENSSKKEQLPLLQNQKIVISGKTYRIKELTIDGKKINVEDLKFHDRHFIEHVQNLAQNAVEKSEIKATSYNISLSENSTIVNETKVEHPVTKKTLNDVKNLGEKILKTQKEEEIFVKKHSFKSRIPSLGKATAIKASAVALIILTSPLIILMGTIIAGGAFLMDLTASIKHGINKTDNLMQEQRAMKGTEEEKKFLSLQEVHNSTSSKAEVPNFVQNQEFLTKNLQNKVERHLDKANVRMGLPIDQARIKEITNDLNINDFKNEESLKRKLFSLFPKLDTVLTDADIALIAKEAKVASINTYDSDQKALNELQSALSVNPSNYPDANKRVLSALRNVINSPSYQAIKENPDHPLVKYVSHLSLALWNNVQVIDNYQEFGKKVLNSVDQTAIRQDPNLTSGQQQRQIMEEAHKKTKQQIYTDHGLAGKILYAFTHPSQSFGSLTSEGGWKREIAGAFGFGDYDSHKDFNNSPSLQGTTNATFKNGKEVVINNCYGGSPTIGNRYQTEVAPEFHAACQAVENNMFAKQKDLSIPAFIYYTNLQNIENHHGEGERSFAIMDLNRQYPHSFVGMTLAKDSKFYLMPDEAGKKWPGAETFGKEMLSIFENEKCYQYGSRTKTENKNGDYKGGNGIYLPGHQKQWLGEDGKSGPIHEIIKQANSRFEEVEKTLKANGKEADSFTLKGAYQEYVYNLIQSYTEAKLANDISERKEWSPKFVIMAIRACKENIDRGGAENAKYAYSRMGDDFTPEERDQIVVGAMESRALLARDRVILEHRMDHALSFMELIDPKDMQKDTVSLLKTQDIEFAKDKEPHYQPAIQKDMALQDPLLPADHKKEATKIL